MMNVSKRKVEAIIKPECVISSGYDPIKSEETDDEDMYKDTNTSNLQPINIKQEAVKAEVKAEEDGVSTDDEQYSPEYVISSSGYIPVKSEETDDEELGEDTNNTSNEHHLPIKEESNDSTNVGECNSERRRRKSPRLLTVPTAQSNASIQESIDSRLIDIHTKKKRRYCSKRKREVEESDGSVQKTARIECSIEGCTRKAAGNGKCWKVHNGYDLCKHEGCTKAAQKGGVCTRHKEFAIDRMAGCTTCSIEGCTRKAADSGTCKTDHGGYNICSQNGCTNQTKKKGGVCMKHGAVVKTCSHEGCTKYSQKSGFCKRHYKLSNGESVAV